MKLLNKLALACLSLASLNIFCMRNASKFSAAASSGRTQSCTSSCAWQRASNQGLISCISKGRYLTRKMSSSSLKTASSCNNFITRLGIIGTYSFLAACSVNYYKRAKVQKKEYEEYLELLQKEEERFWNEQWVADNYEMSKEEKTI